VYDILVTARGSTTTIVVATLHRPTIVIRSRSYPENGTVTSPTVHQIRTEHLLFGHVQTGHAETWIGVGVETVDGELPVVHAPGEPDTAEGHAVFESLAGHRHVVGRETQFGRAQARVEREPGH